jgi:hypothetical protein
MTNATEERVDSPNPDAAEQGEQHLERVAGPAISLGLAPREVESAWRFAKMLAGSTMVPKQFQNRPEDVIVAIQYGVEVGLPPMASLQSIAVINGRPGLWGDGLLSVIVSFGAYARHEEYFVANGERCQSLLAKDFERDDTKAVARFWRKGNSEPFVGEFSVGDAKKANLWGKEGPWKNYPSRMMKMRARSFGARDGFPDALRGLKALDELQDIEVVAEAVPHVAPAEPVRRSEKAAAPATPTEAATIDAPEPPRAASASATVKPPAATRKPESKSQPGNGPSVVTENLIVTATSYIAIKGQDPYWEIKASTSGEPPVAMTFITVEDAAYKLAESCEGTGALVNVRWHGGKRQDGSACKVLETIVAAN